MISVIIPVYNSEKTIEKCLDSLYAQTYRDFECVLVNDGSTDSSLSIIENYQVNHQIENMQILSIENHGQGFARNVGIRQSKGEFISFLDSDDALKEMYLEHLIEKMDEDTEMVVSQIERSFEYKPSRLEKSFKYSEDLKAFYHQTIESYPDLMFEVINAPFAKLIRKSFLLNNDIYFPENIIYEDMVFTHKILASKARVTSVTGKDYLYIVRKGSTMTGNKKVEDIFTAMDQVIENYSKVRIDKDHLDYFIFHHVCIGGMYRILKLNPKKLLKKLHECKIYIAKNQCNLTHNSIINGNGIFIKLLSKGFR